MWKKEKKEIKKLIHELSYNYIILETERKLSDSLYLDSEKYYQTREESPTGQSVYDLQFEKSMEIAKLECRQYDIEERLKELGVY